MDAKLKVAKRGDAVSVSLSVSALKSEPLSVSVPCAAGDDSKQAKYWPQRKIASHRRF
jgi:hypothetical protein